LSPEEIGLMNEIKEKGAELGDLVGRLEAVAPEGDQGDQPGRWVAVGKTHVMQRYHDEKGTSLKELV